MTPPDHVLVHPPVARRFTVLEHPTGELEHLGDALGADCTVVDFVGGWVMPYRTDGASNEDWFGWREELLSPFAGSVIAVRGNDSVNQPGELGSPPAASIIFSAPDGTHVVYAHVQDVSVSVGDLVRPGQAVGRVGNNGVSRQPHVHIGAWRDDAPLQIRFDLEAHARSLAAAGVQ